MWSTISKVRISNERNIHTSAQSFVPLLDMPLQRLYDGRRYGKRVTKSIMIHSYARHARRSRSGLRQSTTVISQLSAARVGLSLLGK